MADLKKLYGKTGGFMKGICHPDNDRDSLLELGLGWVRRDIPFPFDADGNETKSFADYKRACEFYAEKGIYTVGITPYPSAFINAGINVQTEEGLEKAGEVCKYLALSLGDSVRCWQVTNEMHISHFRAPLTREQSVEFLIKCTKGLRAGAPSGCIGHNSCCQDWLEDCKEIEKAVGGNDYIGLDCYAGTWGPGDTDTYEKEINGIYEMLGLPVILMEFGYSSLGAVRNDQEAEADIREHLISLGFSGREDAVARYRELEELVPPVLANWSRRCSPKDRPTYVVDAMNHVLKHWRYDGGFSHTEQGQADFYAELLPKLLENPHLGGAVLYCWKDSKTCFTCGQDDCPCETAWGILRMDGSRKPAFEAIKKVFA